MANAMPVINRVTTQPVIRSAGIGTRSRWTVVSAGTGGGGGAMGAGSVG